ncbi:MAG: MobA/MobL family protein [Cyanobacteria bacterium]|jgi:hypothetical protein|nr:MobA/MobL family protein [Cyanobacteria bacterium GSL.Bin21]
MAIYHLNLKHISRGKGGSACAAAAYISASEIDDQRLGKTHNYRRKEQVDYTQIIAPSYAPDWVTQREKLWNEVEARDNRRNSRPASQIEVALPIELSHDQQKELVREFVEKNLTDRGLVADIALHNLDTHNPHAHILYTTRTINEQGLGAKDRGILRKDFLKQAREQWEHQTNQALTQAQRPERIDHRSLASQGISDRVPQIHLGPNVADMKRRGIPTDRGDQYDQIAATNAQLAQLYQQERGIEQELQQEIQKRQEEKPAPPTKQPSPEKNKQEEKKPEPPTGGEIWEQYSQKITAQSPVERSRKVARQALADGYSQDEVRLILTFDPQIREVDQKQGREKAEKHIQTMIRKAEELNRNEAKKNQIRVTDLEKWREEARALGRSDEHLQKIDAVIKSARETSRGNLVTLKERDRKVMQRDHQAYREQTQEKRRGMQR